MKVSLNFGYEIILRQYLDAINVSNKKIVDDLVMIASWLGDIDLISEALAKLNHDLTVIVQEQGLLHEDTKLGLKDYYPGLPYKHHKVFSSLLKKWAAENGFAETQIFRGGLLPDVFLNKIHSGALFKDVGRCDWQHGEWTHIIQWYCIAEIDKKCHKLNLAPVELLKFLGADARAEKAQLWMLLFESGSEFCNVEKFNKYLVSENFGKACPVLHQLIVGRLHRREQKCSLAEKVGSDECRVFAAIK